jgi:hypothetical protein
MEKRVEHRQLKFDLPVTPEPITFPDLKILNYHQCVLTGLLLL